MSSGFCRRAAISSNRFTFYVLRIQLYLLYSRSLRHTFGCLSISPGNRAVCNANFRRISVFSDVDRCDQPVCRAFLHPSPTRLADPRRADPIPCPPSKLSDVKFHGVKPLVFVVSVNQLKDSVLVNRSAIRASLPNHQVQSIQCLTTWTCVHTATCPLL